MGKATEGGAPEDRASTPESPEFLQVPSYLALLANRPFDRITSPATRAAQQIGFQLMLTKASAAILPTGAKRRVPSDSSA